MDSPLLTYVVLALGVHLCGFSSWGSFRLLYSARRISKSPSTTSTPAVTTATFASASATATFAFASASSPAPAPATSLSSVPLPSPSPRAPPPPPRKSSHRPNSTQPSKNKTPGPNHRLHNDTPSKEKLNLGKKIGLLFMGIVVMLQVCVVAFLMIKRRQLFKDQYMY